MPNPGKKRKKEFELLAVTQILVHVYVSNLKKSL